MTHWTIDDLPWSSFDPARVDPTLVGVVKAAALVERNAAHYTAYLCNVFADDDAFKASAHDWAVEEQRHGDTLGRWAELADPGFSFHDAFRRFTDGYHIPAEVTASIRGSRTGELMARCMVEIGTSSFYTSLHQATAEPLLATICRRIAADELRHYKLFYTCMKTYQQAEGVGRWRRLAVAVARFRETEDDELAYAWHAANDAAGTPYQRTRCTRAYGRSAFSLYRRHIIDRAVAMMFKAAGFTPHGRAARLASRVAWAIIRAKAA